MGTLEKVRKIVVEQLGVDASAVVEGASFIEDLGADSLAVVELVLAFEEGFKIDIPEGETEKILTVGDAVAYIEEHLGRRAPQLAAAPAE